MLLKVWTYIKNPTYSSYADASITYKKRILFACVGWCITIGLFLSVITSILTQIFSLDVGKHASAELLSQPLYIVFLFVGIAAPVIEEIIFRAPLSLFKNSNNFKYAYYVSVLGFGAMHISNFEFSQQVLCLAPLLVAPQIAIGFFLGFIRVRLGLLWSMALHATYNTILFLPMVLVKIFNIPIE